MTELVVGIRHIRDEVETLSTLGAEMSVIAIVGTAPAADTEAFPLDVPTYLTTSDRTSIAALGTTGTVPDAVSGISAQLATNSARIVVVRVADDASPNNVITNIVGNEGLGTGLWALLDAGNELAVIPRIIVVPGYTSQYTTTDGSVTVTRATKSGGNTGNGAMTLAGPAYGSAVKDGVYQVRCIGGARSASSAAKAGGNTGNGTVGSLSADTGAVVGAWRAVCQVAITNGGSFAVYRPDGTFDGIAVVGTAYNSPNGPNFTIADGATDFVVGDEFVITIANAVPANGGVFSVTDPDGNALAQATVGVAYDTTHLKFTIADGATDFAIGDGFDVTVVVTGGTATANPVVAALPTILDRLRGVAVVDGPSSTRQAWIDWRETIQSDRIIPMCVDVKVLDSSGSVVTRPSSPRIAGILVRRDGEFDGVPSHSAANQAVRGIVGVSRPIGFSLVDAATEGQELIGLNGGIIIKGEAGVEDAISEGGYVYWGTDTCSEDTLWQFYHEVRLRDYIELAQVKSLRYYLGRYNLTRQTVNAVLNTMESFLSKLKVNGDILDYRLGFDPDQNSPEDLRLGYLQVYFKAEEAPVLRKITIRSRRYAEALTTLANSIAVQLASAA